MVAQRRETADAPRNVILQGNVLDVLQSLPDGCVQTIVTSPPYYGLRDYGNAPTVWGGVSTCKHQWGETILAGEGYSSGNRKKWQHQATREEHGEGWQKQTAQGQFCTSCHAWLGSLGLEPTPALYVEHIVQIFRQAWRVLRKDGTLWCNIGDTYYSGKGQPHGADPKSEARTMMRAQLRAVDQPGWNLPHKSLIGIPWRVAFAMQDDGWILRSDIIWAKRNCMPESVKDRPTKAHEYIFLFSKSERYYYDAIADRDPVKATTVKREKRGYNHAFRNQFVGSPRETRHPDGKQLTQVTDPDGRNMRTVWDIPTSPFPEAHFATFPEALPTRCILTATSPHACEYCGDPWRRIVTKGESPPEPQHRQPPKRLEPGQSGNTGNGNMGFRASRLSGKEMNTWRATHPDVTTGWEPTCKCSRTQGTGRCLVLDIFAGACTTLMVAKRLDRDFLGVELSPDYIRMGEDRMQRDEERVQRDEERAFREQLPKAMRKEDLAIIPPSLFPEYD